MTTRPTLDDVLAESPLAALTGDEGIAERLVLLVHRGVDWEVWGGVRRVRYWDAFTDRVRAATYAGATLSEWWQELSAQITSTPRTVEDRADLAALLAHPNQREVLDVLHRHAQTLVLRIRVLAEARRAVWQDKQAHTPVQNGEPSPGDEVDWLGDGSLTSDERLTRFEALGPQPTRGPAPTPGATTEDEGLF